MTDEFCIQTRLFEEWAILELKIEELSKERDRIWAELKERQRVWKQDHPSRATT
jgi:hypothetical protein